jgi:hypothetical protein
MLIPRQLLLVVYLSVLTVLLATLYRYCLYVALVWPLWYGDYGEGIVWQQTLLIPSDRMYGDIATYPFIVFHYPPLYHLITRLVSSFGVDMLFGGRGISLGATILTATLVSVLVYHVARRVERVRAVLSAAIAGLMLFMYRPVVAWSVTMRVDALALALSMAGIMFTVWSVRRPRLIDGAMVCFVLAVYTKQTSIAAPIAAIGALVLVRPKEAWRAVGLGMVLGLIPLIYLEWRTEGRFLRHLVLYNVNPISLSVGWSVLRAESLYGISFLLAAISLAVGWRSVLRGHAGQEGRSIRRIVASCDLAFTLLTLTLYFLISTMMLLTVFKEGASTNYFVASISVWAVLIGLLVANVWELPTETEGKNLSLRHSTLILLPVGTIVLQALLGSLPPTRTLTSLQTMHEMAELRQLIGAATKPVLSDDMVTLLRAGKEVPLEPVIFSILTRTGAWDEAPLIDLLNSRAFAFVVTDSGEPLIHHYTEPVRATIATKYPNTRQLASYIVHLP